VKSYVALANGTHTITVISIDVAGNRDATPLIIPFIVSVPAVVAPPSGGSSSSSSSATPITPPKKETPPLVTFSEQILSTQVFVTPAEKTPEWQPVFNLTNRSTEYICPKLVQVYDEKSLITLDIPTTEFTDDIKAVIMFRGLELGEPKWIQTFEEYKKYGIALNATKFEPYRNVTRAEFVKMLVRSLSCRYEYVWVDSNFPDVDTTKWYAEYITFAVKNGWINGYADGDFRPDAPITRAEAAKILANAIKLTAPDSITSSFKDVPEDSVFVPYIEVLKDKKIISGKTRSTYEPNANISRTEVSRLIYKTFLGGQP
jgi:hypothetical protein